MTDARLVINPESVRSLALWRAPSGSNVSCYLLEDRHALRLILDLPLDRMLFNPADHGTILWELMRDAHRAVSGTLPMLDHDWAE